jgi:hypothetical protein
MTYESQTPWRATRTRILQTPHKRGRGIERSESGFIVLGASSSAAMFTSTLTSSSRQLHPELIAIQDNARIDVCVTIMAQFEESRGVTSEHDAFWTRV